MTYEQASRIVATISAAFPRQTFSPESVAVYADMLTDLDYDKTRQVVRALLGESQWPPTIAEIRSRVIADTVALPEPELAWGLICRRWGDRRGAGDQMVELPTEIKTALDIAGIDPYRFWTADERTWLRREFLDIYGAMHRRLLHAANTGIEDKWAKQLSGGELEPLHASIMGEVQKAIDAAEPEQDA